MTVKELEKWWHEPNDWTKRMWIFLLARFVNIVSSFEKNFKLVEKVQAIAGAEQASHTAEPARIIFHKQKEAGR